MMDNTLKKLIGCLALIFLAWASLKLRYALIKWQLAPVKKGSWIDRFGNWMKKREEKNNARRRRRSKKR